MSINRNTEGHLRLDIVFSTEGNVALNADFSENFKLSPAITVGCGMGVQEARPVL